MVRVEILLRGDVLQTNYVSAFYRLSANELGSKTQANGINLCKTKNTCFCNLIIIIIIINIYKKVLSKFIKSALKYINAESYKSESLACQTKHCFCLTVCIIVVSCLLMLCSGSHLYCHLNCKNYKCKRLQPLKKLVFH